MNTSEEVAPKKIALEEITLENRINETAKKPLSSALLPQFVPQDPKYPEQNNALATINLESAWDISMGSANVIVAVIDDAIDINHPDLKDNLLTGYDFVDRDEDPSPELCGNTSTEMEGHGTQVAGVIGASGNRIGITGVSPTVSILPLRIGCYFPMNLEVEAVLFAIAQGAHIINASYGGPKEVIYNERVLSALQAVKRTVLFVTSAGNQHTNNDDIPMYPSSLDLPNVISVAASTQINELTEWAQYGATSVDLAAPGVDLTTTFEGATRYGLVSGSSFSTAVVSGVAALIKAKDINNELTAPDLKALLQASVTEYSSHHSMTKTAGVVNAEAALNIMDSPRPVMTISQAVYEDSGAIFENSRIDADETGVVKVQLVNLWEGVLYGDVSVSVNNGLITLPTSVFNLSSFAVGERQSLTIPVEVGQLTNHHRIRFNLSINLVSASTNVNYQRYFDIETGILPNKVQTSQRILKNNQDDYQYFHLNIPEGMERVAVELLHDASDTRDMGLLADFSSRPQINFRNFNGAPYWYNAKYRVDNQSDFERIAFRIPATQKSTLNIMAFNSPSNNAGAQYQSNKSYQLKACYYSETDGNVPPVVNAGEDRRVSAGERITLSGTARDTDGTITRAYWRGNNLTFTERDNHQIIFTAPSSGKHTFTFVAIDDGCKQSIDTVDIIVDEVNGSEPEGLILNPRTLNIDENSSFSVRVSGVINSQTVNNLIMLNAPEGVIFTEGNLSWKNAAPIGQYSIDFSAKDEGETFFGTITIKISQRSVGNGGGCTIAKNNTFDPLFLLYIFIACLYIGKKKLREYKVKQSKE